MNVFGKLRRGQGIGGCSQGSAAAPFRPPDELC